VPSALGAIVDNLGFISESRVIGAGHHQLDTQRFIVNLNFRHANPSNTNK
jgi:hypothetical protein